ncbi:MAG TPA: tetratricopeptide repeat protein [Anaerolineae bacterium]|nr:tetratricopeptide repeat protein [Anaerolineae bacterium]
MVIDTRPPRNNRHNGPSCSFVLLMILLIGIFGVVTFRADDVRDVFTPDPTPRPTRNAISCATSADLLTRDGDYEEAIALYECAIRLDPQNVAYILPMIDLLLLTDSTTPAPDWAQTVVNEDDEDDEDDPFAGLDLFEENEQVGAPPPDDPETWTGLEWAEFAVELAPNNDQAWMLMAAAHLDYGLRLAETGYELESGQAYQRTVNAAETAVEINPSNADAYAYMANALAQLARPTFEFSLAQEMADFAMALDPQSVVVRQAMATVMELQGYYNRAIEEYEAAIQLAPNNAELYTSLAYLYFFTDNRQQAILTMETAIDKDPRNADAYDGLGYFYFVVGEYARAEKNAYRAVLLDPEMTRAHAHLGAAYFKNSNYPEAIASLETAIDQYGFVTEQNAIYYNMLGLAYYRNSDDPARCEQANAIFNQVLTVASPDSPAEFNAQEGLSLCRQVRE